MTLIFRDFSLLQEDGSTKIGSLYIDQATGLIIQPTNQTEGIQEVLPLPNGFLSPGLIDIQINGAYLHDFSGLDSSSKETIDSYKSGLDLVCSRLPETGVTSFIPTLFTSPSSSYPITLPLLKPSLRKGARLLGFHTEGPFLNPLKKGAHQENLMRDAQDGIRTFEKIYGEENLRSLEEGEEFVRIITLAPEMKGVGESIEELRKRGIKVAIGHSNATYEETSQAVKDGATLVTHLFNAMSSLSHRSPNLPGYVLSSASTSTSVPNPFFSMISDGIHLSPHIVRLSHRANPKACILITDALPPLDPSLSDGIYPWSRGRELIKEGDALYVKGSEVLAGSCASLSTCVRNLSEFAKISIPEALICATLNPAKFLGMENQIGTLRIGARADFVIWNKVGGIESVWIGGKKLVG